MSSPILLDDTGARSTYAPPWARDRIPPVAEPGSRPQPRTTAAAEMKVQKSKLQYSGDRAMLALQRQLALDPDLIPEPSSEGVGMMRRLMIRLCSVTALAAAVAWGVVSYSAVKKTAEFIPADTHAAVITSSHGTVAEVQPLRLRPTLPQPSEAPAQVSKSQAVAVASAGAEAVIPGTVAMAAAARSDTPPAPRPSERANERPALRLDSEEIAVLLKRGSVLLANGDLTAARLVFRRAAEAGSAEGALALGTTFDPVVLQRLGTIGAVADPARARQWYQRAAELGSSAASQQLAGLAEGH